MSLLSRKATADELSIRLERDGVVLYESTSSALPLPLKIGRGADCAWRVPDDERSVSSRHAEIFLRRKGLFVKDLGSRNGLYVMGARVVERRLASGLQVSLGSCRLLVEKSRAGTGARARPFHRLERLNGESAGVFYDLVKASTVIGSGVTDGILCSDLLVSKRHAEIVRKSDDTCWIRDLGSRNGTQVNKVALKDADRMLRDGDVVSVADVEFKFRDRHFEHAGGHLLAKLCVALVTAAVCGSAYFVWQTLSPSATSVIRNATRCESAGLFDEALKILETASVARGGEYYRDEVARKRGEIEIWKNTVDTWRKVRQQVAGRAWVSASKNLGALLNASTERWGWNTMDAQQEKLKARKLKELVDVFLAARTALGGTFAEDEEGDERAALNRLLVEMDRALRDPAWTDAIPAGPLRGDMAEQADAVREVIADLDRIARTLVQVRVSGRQDLDGLLKLNESLPVRIGELEAVIRRNSARDAERRAAAERSGRVFVTSPIVSRNCEKYLPTLRAFLVSGETLAENVRRLASGSYGLTREMPLPSEGQCAIHPEFGEIRRSYQIVNARLCGEVESSVRDQLSRLRDVGLDANGPLPACLADFLDEGFRNAALDCDAFSHPRPHLPRTEPCGRYDALLGLETFADYLREIDGSRELRCAMDGSRPVPSVVRATALLRQAERFSRFAASSYVRRLIAEPTATNVLREAARMTSDIDSKRALLVELLWNDDSPALRRRIVARALAMAFDDKGSLGDDAPLGVLDDLRALGRSVAALRRKIEQDPDRVDEYRAEILKIAIPGLNGANAIWEQVSKKRGGSR
ncbi:MAG: FHA domain-containing protein [Kiritimatiellia bacterium]